MGHPTAAVIVTCVLATFSALPVAAETAEERGVVISSGIEGGGYWSAATRFSAIAQGMGFTTAVQASTGSLDNLAQLTDPDGPVGLAFAQADALQFYLDGHPEVSPQIQIMENLGQECVFIVTGSNSGLRTDADLQNPDGQRLGIGSPDSGVAVTFNYMASQVPKLQHTRVNFIDTQAAVAQLNDDQANVDAVMVVHRPREHSTEVTTALANPDSYRFVAVDNDQLSRELPGGDKVYQSMDLVMRGPGENDKTVVKTICVKGLLLANRQKLSETQQDQVHDLVNQHWGQVFRTE